MLSNKTGNIYASIKLDENGPDIVTLSGSMESNGRFSVNRYVNDYAVYKANRETIRKDEEEFEESLIDVSKTVTDETEINK